MRLLTAALAGREKTGNGCQIDFSMLDGQVSLLTLAAVLGIVAALETGRGWGGQVMGRTAAGRLRISGAGAPEFRTCAMGAQQTGGAHIALLESEPVPSVNNRFAADSDPAGDLQNRFAGLMRLVQLQEITRREFAGHVYNLETRDGIYFANTIISHNCTCDLEYKEFQDLAIMGIRPEKEKPKAKPGEEPAARDNTAAALIAAAEP